jgi:hypothetical protein
MNHKITWWLQGGGPTYRLDGCFTWALGSYDVLGLYPESTSAEGSFYQPELASDIKRHNAEVARLNTDKGG